MANVDEFGVDWECGFHMDVMDHSKDAVHDVVS
jgi:hypothetical protein